jgi:hypothetical protein
LRQLTRLVRHSVDGVDSEILRADLAHAILSVVIEYRQPIRSAITVAGMVGHSANNSRSWFSTASASLTRGPRSRRGS